MSVQPKLDIKNKNIDTILVLDFGSQYTQLIARRIRESDVYSEILPWDVDIKKIKDINPKGIILSGGPESVTDLHTPRAPKIVFDLKVPILGICYGMQTLAEQMGGQVTTSEKKEFGFSELTIEDESKLFKGLSEGFHNVWMSHGDKVETLPTEFKLTASTKSAPIAAMEHSSDSIFALQFHPEVTHTEKGILLLKNFVFGICKSKKNWSTDHQKKTLIKNVQNQIGNKKIICALSGGVDSSVVAQLLNKAVGKQLHCIFVNTGLLRLNEEKQVVNTFKKKLKMNLIYVNAADEFLKKLINITDPEKKRKIIGNLFIKIFERYAKKLKNVKFLAQGTLYPDLIESKSVTGSQTSKIKSHHNVGGLPKKMKLELCEPLRLLFKDEVRKLGIKLNLSKDIISRHPFPGPGLAIRMPGKVSKDKIEILKQADNIFISELKKEKLYDKIWQAYAALLPFKTVGVMGDSRTYEYTCMLRAVTSEDGMTADYFNFEKYFLDKVSSKIVNNVKGINRVVFDVTSKPPSTIELE